MTITVLTLLLLGYMKMTGRTIPSLEKRLNKVKNSKNKNQIVEMASIAEKEIASIDTSKIDKVSFKKNNILTLCPKIYSGSLKI